MKSAAAHGKRDEHRVMSADVRIDDDFELSVAEQGTRFRTLYVRVLPAEDDASPRQSAAELRDRAVAGCAESQVAWAHRLLNGKDVPRDAEAAFRWFSQAARTGNADALNMLGRCYEFGWGVARSGADAIRYFTRAAEKGHAWGEFNLASHYAQGGLVPPDERKAVTLLVRSARRGNPKAMNMLGRYRENSNDARARARSAPLWYRWAAERGCFRGEFHHGRYLVASGRVSDGIRFFRTSLSHAPEDFRDEAIAYLAAHALPQVRELVAALKPGDRGAAL